MESDPDLLSGFLGGGRPTEFADGLFSGFRENRIAANHLHVLRDTGWGHENLELDRPFQAHLARQFRIGGRYLGDNGSTAILVHILGG